MNIGSNETTSEQAQEAACDVLSQFEQRLD